MEVVHCWGGFYMIVGAAISAVIESPSLLAGSNGSRASPPVDCGLMRVKLVRLYQAVSDLLV